MEKCYFSQKNIHLRYFCLIGTIVCSSTMFAICFANWNKDTDARSMLAILFALGCVVLLYGLFLDIYFSREYELTEHGILIRYAKCISRFYSWDSINQICVCIIHRSANGVTWDEVIWCTSGNITKGPPHSARHWNSTEYGLLHINSVLTMEYSSERLAQFHKYAPINIEDYRKL